MSLCCVSFPVCFRHACLCVTTCDLAQCVMTSTRSAVCIWLLKWFSKQKCQHYKPELSRPICAALTVPDTANTFSYMHLIWQFDCVCDESQYTTQPRSHASGLSDQLYLLWRQTAGCSHTPPHFIRVPFDFVSKFSVKLLTTKKISELKRIEKKNKNMWYKNVILYERVQFKAYFENAWLSLKMQSEHKLFYRCFISLVVGRRYCRTGSKYFHTNSIKDAQLHFRNFKTAGASESVVIPLCSWCWLMSAILILFVCLSFFFLPFGGHMCACAQNMSQSNSRHASITSNELISQSKTHSGLITAISLHSVNSKLSLHVCTVHCVSEPVSAVCVCVCV